MFGAAEGESEGFCAGGGGAGDGEGDEGGGDEGGGDEGGGGATTRATLTFAAVATLVTSGVSLHA